MLAVHELGEHQHVDVERGDGVQQRGRDGLAAGAVVDVPGGEMDFT